MLTQKQELYNVIESLPEELSGKIIDYVEYVKFSYVMDRSNAPADLVVTSKEELIKKLEEGERDIENGNVCSLAELYAELDEIVTS
ncbi:MAG: hypothetical protein FWC75_07460 [Oscillospiraceae bacterium]|nr:hypothetical protein [Oscillospiraceae bacterium]